MMKRKQRGMAVIGALIVVAVTAVMATSSMERQASIAEVLSSERDRTQAKWLLRAGLDWARLLLLNDARNNAVTLRSAIWAQPIADMDISQPGDAREARFSGVIEDEQGKFNLSRLASNGQIQPREVAALQQLLSSVGMPAALSSALAKRIAAAQTSSSASRTAPGLRSIHELAHVEGLTPSVLQQLADYLTILPQTVPLNVNTARAEVLVATFPGLGLAEARALTQARDEGLWFSNRGDFLNRLNEPEIVQNLPIDVRSEWFKVTGEVRMQHAAVSMRALLQRPGTSIPIVRWMED